MDTEMKKQLIQTLYTQNYTRISSYCYLKLGNKADVEEVVSDTFYKAFNALDTTLDKSAYTPWLYTIARNTIYDRSKNYFNKNVYPDMNHVERSESNENIEENIMKEDSYKELHSKINNLPSEQKEAIVLRYLHELEYVEISSVMERSVNAIKLLISRGLKTLRLESGNGNKKLGMFIPMFFPDFINLNQTTLLNNLLSKINLTNMNITPIAPIAAHNIPLGAAATLKTGFLATGIGKAIAVGSIAAVSVAAAVTGTVLVTQNDKKIDSSNKIITSTQITKTTSVITSSITPTTPPIETTVVAKTGSEIIPLNSESNQYNNYDYGFSIIYPKTPRGAGTCVDPSDSTSQPTQIIEDIPNKIVYIAYKTQPLRGLNDSCSIKNIDLNLIKNGIPYSSGSYKSTSYPTNFPFHFKTTNNDADIATFANEVYDITYQNGKLCTIGSKTLTDSTNQEYKILLNSNAGPNGYDDGTKCPLNFKYDFVYSNSKNLSITWAIGQQPAFGGNPTTNKEYVLQAQFIN